MKTTQVTPDKCGTGPKLVTGHHLWLLSWAWPGTTQPSVGKKGSKGDHSACGLGGWHESMPGVILKSGALSHYVWKPCCHISSSPGPYLLCLGHSLAIQCSYKLSHIQSFLLILSVILI